MKSVHVCIKTVLGLENLITIVTSVNFTKMIAFVDNEFMLNIFAH